MEDNNNKGSGRKIIIIVTVFFLLIVAAFFLIKYLRTGNTKSYDQFWADVKANNVAEIKFTSSIEMQVTLKDKYTYKVTVSDRTIADEIYHYYDENKETVSMPTITNYNTANAINWGSIIQIVSILLFVLLGLFLVFYMFGKNGQGGAMTFGKTKNRVVSNVKVRFTDVAGAEEEKTELKEIVDFLKNPKKFSAIGAKIPRGVLLVGPPGTGKTLFAKAVAGEANVPFFSISGSDFVEMFVGVGASRVRDLFAQAKRNMPCIVFIDEIDAVGRQRGAGLGGGNDEREQTLNQLLVQMDGFDTNDGIIVMAATNRADILDPALLRPGRFDRQIYVNIPDVKGREEIFKVHARNKPLASDIDFKVLARITSGFSGADIANLLNEAAILAARADRNIIIMKDILEGINKVIAGPQKKSRVITESDKRITSYHESGHAVVGKFMKYCDDVQEVSIIPRGMAAGYTISRPKNDNSHVTYNKLNDEIAMLLGGRASEEIFIQDISTGASNDIQRATELARRMVTEWGMSPKLPNLYYGGSQEVFLGRDYQTQVNYGDDVAKTIDEEIKKIIDYNYKRAYDCINEHKDVIEKMVRLLYDRETIYSDEVDMIVDGKTLEEINAYIDDRQSKLDEEAKKYEKKKPTPVENPAPFEPASTIIIKEEKDTDNNANEPSSDEPAQSEQTDSPTPETKIDESVKPTEEPNSSESKEPDNKPDDTNN